MDIYKNRAMHGLLNQLGLMDQKASLVSQVSNGRTASSKDLSNYEADALCKILRDEKERRVKGVRGKIIHQLCLLGYVKDDGSADYDRINDFIQNIGNRNPHKRKLLSLWPSEMVAVCSQVHQMYLKEMKQ